MSWTASFLLWYEWGGITRRNRGALPLGINMVAQGGNELESLQAAGKSAVPAQMDQFAAPPSS